MSSLHVNCASNSTEVASDKPIIGILAQEAHSVRHLFPDENVHSFIAASYVKFIESAGGRVLPIMIGEDYDYYKGIVEKTNGLLLPGGAALFSALSDYAEAGMEFLIQASLNGQDIRSDCLKTKKSLPLIFKNDIQTSRLFCEAPKNILHILSAENVTANSHRYCFTEKTFQEHKLIEWRVLSTNFDDNGLEFISSYEHKKWPFYGVQFHPEKNAFECEPQHEHGEKAIIAAQYFGFFFIAECRKNNHHSDRDLRNDLILRHTPVDSGRLGSIYKQIYLFGE